MANVSDDGLEKEKKIGEEVLLSLVEPLSRAVVRSKV